MSAPRRLPDEDLTDAVAADAQPAALHAQQAWAARLQDLQAATAADAQLGHAADPGGLAVNVSDVAALTRPQVFQR